MFPRYDQQSRDLGNFILVKCRFWTWYFKVVIIINSSPYSSYNYTYNFIGEKKWYDCTLRVAEYASAPKPLSDKAAYVLAYSSIYPPKETPGMCYSTTTSSMEPA